MKRIFTFLLSFGCAALQSEVTISFKAEFSKNSIYVGESVTCNFIVYSPETVLEVEVAKFPEFRGFWSQNMILRQGPIALPRTSFQDAFGKAIIGSYELTPMISPRKPVIIPMKLVIRRGLPRTTDTELVVLSDADPLEIKPLPPVPPEFANDFSGAVGNFSFQSDSDVVPFQLDEPTTFRYTLRGEGNFEEINELSPKFPKGVELLSSRAFLQGGGRYPTKTFEYVIAVHDEDLPNLDPLSLIYFDPQTGQYERLTAPSIRLTRQAKPALSVVDSVAAISVAPLQQHASLYVPIARNPWFWILHILVLGGLLAPAARQPLRWTQPGRTSPRTLHKGTLKKLLAETRSPTLFAEAADQWAFEAFGSNRLLKRADVINLVQSRSGTEAGQAIKTIFEAHQLLAYSPHKGQAPSSDQIRDALATLCKHL